ncbi:MAG: inositol monophosphatase [Gammaproteobacteria bacterium]|nr:inositol monophosphatase [Gammaproteobacteria bacterium]
MHPMLNTAITAARQAGNIIARSADRIETLTIKSKGRNDFVSEIDQQAEQEIIKVIRKAYPSHGILAEESGSCAGDDYVWIIDPLDGTTNFLHSFPQFAISIALKHKNKLDQAVIYDPIRQELFTASRGVNAQLNGRRLRVTQVTSLANTLIGTGFPYSDMKNLDSYINIFKNMIPETAGLRRAGAASLDLAYVAAGRLDGFWEYGLKPWDLAAGALLIQEAGGLVSDFAGGTDFFESGDVVAGNAKVLKALLQTIKRHQL